MFNIRCPNYFVENLATHRLIFKRQLTNCYPSKEVQFPVSWGHIAGQVGMGQSQRIPVLAVHGWLDNSGSFEPLVPHLLDRHNLHIVAIDEPGCGLSSHKPRGSDYNRWSHLRDMKRVRDQLDWNQDVTLIGHSLGAIYSLLFASVYPSIVKRVVSLDIVKPSTSWLGYVSGLPKIIEKHNQVDKLFIEDPTMESRALIYSIDEAIERMVTGSGHSLIRESAEVMIKRAVNCSN